MATKTADNDSFVFRRNDEVGAADALDDVEFLSTCFVDNGDLEVLADVTDRHRIVVGRTGSGKSALLWRLGQTEEHVINLEPETLALEHLSNSTILNWLVAEKVDIDLFLKLLWRHVLAVELLRYYFDRKSMTPRSISSRLREWFSGAGKRHTEAMAYFAEFGDRFWEDADRHVKEITEKLESSLKSELGWTDGDFRAGGTTEVKASAERKAEVVQRAKLVISRVQIRQLSKILDMLNDLLEDPQQSYFILVDRLDEKWVSSSLRSLLIRALIETVREFRKVQRVKVVIAIRRDVYDRVVAATQDAGFQAEKHADLFLEVRWSADDIQKLLDRRVGHLVRRRYTKRVVRLADVLPSQIRGKPAVEYMVSRSMLRPRGAIQFMNACIKQAEGKTGISVSMIYVAEKDYSKTRLTAVEDEWRADYPNLHSFAVLLRRRPTKFEVGGFCDDETQSRLISILATEMGEKDELVVAATAAVNAGSWDEAIRRIICVFHRVGIVGIRPTPYDATCWADKDSWVADWSALRSDAVVSVHPAFRPELDVSFGPDR